MILQDRRSDLEAGYTLRTATTDANRQYTISVRPERPGYADR